MKFTRGILVFLSLVVLSACASLSDQAKKALQNGEYENALQLYNKAQKQDPQNGEILEGLRVAQIAWLNRKLIDVRLLRLGGNLGESEALLLKIIQYESEWQVFPTGAAFTTQNEEINKVSERIEIRIQNYLAEGNPLGAQVEFNKNEFFLGQAKKANLANTKVRIYKAAQKFCSSKGHNVQATEFYTSQWFEKTCKIWQLPTTIGRVNRPLNLFKDVSVSSELKNLNSNLKNTLNQNIRAAFLKSSWADEKGTAILKLKTSGEFLANQSETPTRRTSEYTVEIPYEETFKRIKKPSTENSGVLGLIDLLAGSPNEEKVRDNGDGSETVTVTKYRSEPRSHYYSVVEVKASKNLKGEIQATLDNLMFKARFQEQYNLAEDRHSENFPDLGLHPTNPIVVSDEKWIENISQVILRNLQSELQGSWSERFCKASSKGAEVTEREAIHRCAYPNPNQTPEILQQFYLKTWKIGYADWKALVYNENL